MNNRKKIFFKLYLWSFLTYNLLRLDDYII